MAHFLKTKKTKIVKGNKPFYLRGVNFGGWLMMEAYLLHAPNRPETHFKNNFEKMLGKKELKDFEKRFRDNFIGEGDVKKVARLGLNCIRVPFHYHLIEKKPYQYDRDGLQYLDSVIRWGTKYKVYIILDLHAAPGAQNCDWHADSFGQAHFWTNKNYQKRALALWRFLAGRYKNKEYLAGYDLLNEAVTENTKSLNRFYKEAIRAIRSVDNNHILFIEGNKWATDVNCLDAFDDDNYVLSIHHYIPLDFTFNFVPHMTYPFKWWNKKINREYLMPYKKFADKRQVPVFVGEFGVNFRNAYYGEDKWVKDTLAIFKEFGFHWTYWTYKAKKYHMFPDGLYSYYENPVWVNRLGPEQGWDTYHKHWKTKKSEMTRSFRTEQFAANTPIIKILKFFANK